METRFQDYLDGLNTPMEIGDTEYWPSEVLMKCDRDRYDRFYEEWLNYKLAKGTITDLDPNK